jgi:hypothetical protein
MSSGSAQRLRLLGLAVAVSAVTGCASLLGSYDVAPSGLAGSEDRLRRMLVGEQAPAAFERVQKSAPDDEMLHALYHGVLAYHAGRYAESARALDIAAHIADERMTLSLSRAALSLVTSDLALQYAPGRTERLMIPYYAALARMRMGDREGAAVEARRLSMLLQRFDDEGAAPDPALRATLRYVAGAVFEWSGERGDADVAFRNAAALDPSLAPYRGSAGSGTVLIVLEQGFVAHRVEQGLAVMLLPEEVHAIAHGGADDKALASLFVAGRIIDHTTRGPYASTHTAGGQWHRSGTLHVPAPDRSLLPAALRRTVACTSTAAAATAVVDTVQASAASRTATAAQTSPDTSRVVPGPGRIDRGQAVRTQAGSQAGAQTGTQAGSQAGAATRGGRTDEAGRECTTADRQVEDLPYLLRVAWPAYRSEHRPQTARVIAGADTTAFVRFADISGGVVADFEKERAALLARTVARSTAKLALTKGAERRLEERSEVAGRIVSLLGNVSTALLERADTRSWHLLPAGVSVVRLELPAGDHDLTVDIGGRRIAVGPVTVRAGTVDVLPVRAW